MLKSLFLLFFIFKQVSFFIPLNCKAKFHNYSIENFSQSVETYKEKGIIKIKINYFYKKLPQISKGFLFLKSGENRRVDNIVLNIYNASESYTDYVKNVLMFVQSKLKYSEKSEPQDVNSVLKRGSAYCTGYTNLTFQLLKKAGVKVKKITGFYFYKDKNVLQKHSWIEVFFPSHGWFAIDPITGKFSNFYIYGDIEKGFISLKDFSITYSIQN